MTIKELRLIMDRAKKEADQFYKEQMDRERENENNCYKKKLNEIRAKAYELNKEVGFYGIAGMSYNEFLEAMKHYSYEERMWVSFAFLRHISLLDNIIFDEEDDECIL